LAGVCAQTSQQDLLRQEIARRYPGVDFQAQAPVAVRYAEPLGPASNAVRAVLRELGEKGSSSLQNMARAGNVVMQTQERALGDLLQ